GTGFSVATTDATRTRPEAVVRHVEEQQGLMRSNADGVAVSDPDWTPRMATTASVWTANGFDVPDEAVIKEPNRAGRTMVWPIHGAMGMSIQCFLPGTMS